MPSPAFVLLVWTVFVIGVFPFCLSVCLCASLITGEEEQDNPPSHHHHHRRRGIRAGPMAPNPNTGCQHGKIYSKGLCKTCYSRWRRFVRSGGTVGTTTPAASAPSSATTMGIPHDPPPLEHHELSTDMEGTSGAIEYKSVGVVKDHPPPTTLVLTRDS